MKAHKKAMGMAQWGLVLALVIITGFSIILIIDRTFPGLFEGISGQSQDIMNTIGVESNQFSEFKEAPIPSNAKAFMIAIINAIEHPEQFNDVVFREASITPTPPIENQRSVLKQHTDYLVLLKANKHYGQVVVQYAPKDTTLKTYEKRINLISPETTGSFKDQYRMIFRPLTAGDYDLHFTYYVGDQNETSYMIPVRIRSSSDSPSQRTERITAWKILDNQNTLASGNANMILDPSQSVSQIQDLTLASAANVKLQTTVQFAQDMSGYQSLAAPFRLKTYVQSPDNTIAVLVNNTAVPLTISSEEPEQEVQQPSEESEIEIDLSSITLSLEQPDLNPNSTLTFTFPNSFERGSLLLILENSLKTIHEAKLPSFVIENFKWGKEKIYNKNTCLIQYEKPKNMKDPSTMYYEEEGQIFFEQIGNDFYIQYISPKGIEIGDSYIVKNRQLCVVGGNDPQGFEAAKNFYRKFNFGNYAPNDAATPRLKVYHDVRNIRFQGTSNHPRIYINEEQNSELTGSDFGLILNMGEGSDGKKRVCLLTSSWKLFTSGTRSCFLDDGAAVTDTCLEKASSSWKTDYPVWRDEVYC